MEAIRRFLQSFLEMMQCCYVSTATTDHETELPPSRPATRPRTSGSVHYTHEKSNRTSFIDGPTLPPVPEIEGRQSMD